MKAKSRSKAPWPWHYGPHRIAEPQGFGRRRACEDPTLILPLAILFIDDEPFLRELIREILNGTDIVSR